MNELKSSPYNQRKLTESLQIMKRMEIADNMKRIKAQVR